MEEALREVNFYDELRDDNQPDYDPATMKSRAAKNLSLKLLETETVEQVLKIFEHDLVRPRKEREPHGEELALVLKFLQNQLQSYEPEAAQELLASEPLIPLLIQWLMGRFTDLEFEYKVAVFYSLGYMINAFDYRLEDETHYKKLLDAMDDYVVQTEQRASLPALVFMLPAFGVDGDLGQV